MGRFRAWGFMGESVGRGASRERVLEGCAARYPVACGLERAEESGGGGEAKAN